MKQNASTKRKATSERNFGMSKYIIKNCPVCEFSDWEECTGYLAEGYICNDIHTEIVECKDRTDCVMKQIVERLKQVAYACHCDNCDGCGYYSGCGDTECGTYQALKSLELLQIEEVR